MCVWRDTKEAAYSIVECETRHVHQVPLELYDHPALPEEIADEWIERDGGVVEEEVSCAPCADKADRNSEHSVVTAAQRLEVALRRCHCGHEVGVQPTTSAS